MNSYNIPIHHATDEQILSIVAMLQSAGYTVDEPKRILGLKADYAALPPSARTLYTLLVVDGRNRWNLATIYRLHVQGAPSIAVTQQLTDACLVELLENHCAVKKVSDPDSGNILTGGSIIYELL